MAASLGYEIVVKKLLLLGLLQMTFAAYGQDLVQHRWNHRVIIISVENTQSQIYQDQIEELATNLSGLNERKLVVYTITQSAFRQEFQSLMDWNAIPTSFQHFQPNVPFQISLIGLDGGVKLQQQTVLNCPSLYALIDGMPMRRAELRQKNRDEG
ncbi:MAG TPA: hypothetical protein DCE41_27045 [Cytophagales bacterium]|nr:hypothetical protein [Cytophagales bacterium]HAA22630.1 hypothetical protein [Cytophagales bacterium]HAP61109.1 hypothetical protein [Cytophagales bacterium]